VEARGEVGEGGGAATEKDGDGDVYVRELRRAELAEEEGAPHRLQDVVRRDDEPQEGEHPRDAGGLARSHVDDAGQEHAQE